MIGLISTIAGGLFDLGKEYFSKKKEEADAKHIRKLELIKQGGEWEKTMAQGSLNSFKDEFWTIVLAVPLIILWIGVMFDLPVLLERSEEAFNLMRTMPEWYLYTLGVVIAGAFGVKSVINGIGKIKK
jgi:hypothetical protein